MKNKPLSLENQSMLLLCSVREVSPCSSASSSRGLGLDSKWPVGLLGYSHGACWRISLKSPRECRKTGITLKQAYWEGFPQDLRRACFRDSRLLSWRRGENSFSVNRIILTWLKLCCFPHSCSQNRQPILQPWNLPWGKIEDGKKKYDLVEHNMQLYIISL